MLCRGLHKIANLAYLDGFLFSGLHRIALAVVSEWYQEVMDYHSSNTPEYSNLAEAPGQTPTSRYPPGSEKASGSLLTGRIPFTGIGTT